MKSAYTTVGSGATRKKAYAKAHADMQALLASLDLLPPAENEGDATYEPGDVGPMISMPRYVCTFRVYRPSVVIYAEDVQSIRC